jgi:hypothetical protein
MRVRQLAAAVVLAAITAAVALTAPAGAASGCAAAVLQAWHDGRLDSSYPPACYREALSELPEDIRIYSSAEDDINRALIASLAKHRARGAQVGAVKGVVRRLSNASATDPVSRQAAAAAADPTASAVPLTVLVAGAGALALVGTASISVLARRVRRNRAT